MSRWSLRPAVWIPSLIGGGAVALAWRLRFVQDDAFIGFLYARNLVEGAGLTWFGARIEGYTNFLWVLWMALGLRLGAEPVLWSQVGGLAAFAVVLACTWRLARRLDAAWPPALFALGLLATNETVLCFATGGLETMLQSALIVAAACVLARMRALHRRGVGAPSLAGTAVLSLLLGLGALVRLDTVVAGLVLLGFALFTVRRASAPGRAARRLVALLLPGGLLVGAWLGWKLVYYGSLLPHSFHAKVDAAFHWNGPVFLARFAHAYWIWPFLVIVAIVALVRRHDLSRDDRPRRDLGPLVALVAAWCVYVALVGGDFMEFRFMVPVAPVLFVLLGQLLGLVIAGCSPARRGVAVAAAVAALALGSLLHARTFAGTDDATLDSVSSLATYYGLYPDGDWDRIGGALRRDLGDTGVTIACHGVGAIPYYSRLGTVDMWGLNDPDVIARGQPVGDRFRRPGHTVHATVGLLRERGVNLVIGHPQLIIEGTLHEIRDPRTWRGVFANKFVFMNRDPIPVADVVAMPVGGGAAMVMWYLTPHPEIEGLIQDGRWQRMRLEDVGRLEGDLPAPGGDR